VALAFHGEPPSEEHEAARLDSDGRNNRPGNLVWSTRAEISKFSRTNGAKSGSSTTRSRAGARRRGRGRQHLARSTRRRQTSSGWNTAYIGANRYTLPPNETPPADDALHPMAFLFEKGPGAVTRPHFHQADQFQVVVAGHGKLGDREFSDGAVHYTDAYSAYGPIVAGKSGIWWFTLRNRWDPGARYMPAEREVLNAARDRHQHWELTTDPMPSALHRLPLRQTHARACARVRACARARSG
jgi:hypothetical protein